MLLLSFSSVAKSFKIRSNVNIIMSQSIRSTNSKSTFIINKKLSNPTNSPKSINPPIPTSSISTSTTSLSTSLLSSHNRKFSKSDVSLFLKRIQEMNKFTEATKRNFIPLVINNNIYGYLTESFLQLIHTYSKGIFEIQNCTSNNIAALHFDSKFQSLSMLEKTQKIQELNILLHQNGFIHGWRNELIHFFYPLS